MLGRRTLVTVASLVALTGAAAVTTHPAHAATRPTDVPTPGVPTLVAAHGPTIVALGDSVPAGSSCHCKNFVSDYADLLAHRVGHSVGVTNFAEGGAQTSDVLDQLKKPAVRHALDDATTVLLMVGANDFYRPFKKVRSGASKSSQYAPAARARLLTR